MGNIRSLCRLGIIVLAWSAAGFNAQNQTLTLSDELAVQLKYGEAKLPAGTKINVVGIDNNHAIAIVAGQRVRIDRRSFVETTEAEKAAFTKVIDETKTSVAAQAEASVAPQAKANDHIPWWPTQGVESPEKPR